MKVIEQGATFGGVMGFQSYKEAFHGVVVHLGSPGRGD
jgi:hypothetical protein